MAVGNNPIGNMVIKVDLDATGFNKSMTGLKRQLKSVNTEMRANLSQFSKSEKSVAKYQTQIDSLTKRHQVQGKAVEQAKKEYDQMVKAHGEGSTKAEEYAIKLNEQIALYNETGREIENVKDALAKFEREQQVFNSGWAKTSRALTTFGDKLGAISQVAMDVGGKLTKYITAPVLGIGTALAGVTLGFGWDRLVQTDKANAKLEGMGYSIKEIGNIQDTVTEAIKGGMTTYAEGVNIAAGAMAAGVKEGKDLRKYIQLVGDSAVASGRPVDEMAMIFNRVQGSGKLMTMELNQIEHGMPGFSQALAKHLKVAPDKMREMVTSGEVTSKDFLAVMDTFAGGMAEAHAKSWSGMVQNTKAYIGIIGEAFLDGIFQDAKESLAEFIAWLETEEAKEWAQELGEKVRVAFNKISDAVKGVITWFRDLDESKQKLILKVGAFAVALGPVLMGLGAVGNVVASVSKGLGTFFGWLAPIMTPLKGLATGASKGGKAFGLLRTGLTALTGPVGLTISIVTGLVTAFTVAYKKSDTFREGVHKLIDKLKEFGGKVREYIQPAIDAVVDFFGEIKEKIQGFVKSEGGQLMGAFKNIGTVIGAILKGIWAVVKWVFDKIKAIVEFVMPFIELIIKSVWGSIKGIITGALDIIMGAIKIFSGLFTGDFSKMWEGVKQLFSGAITFVWNLIQLQFVGKILKIAGTLVTSFSGLMGGLWSRVLGIFKNSVSGVFNSVKNGFIKVLDISKNLNTKMREAIINIWTKILSKLKEIVTNIFNSIKSRFINIFNNVKTITTNIRVKVTDIWSKILTSIKNIVTNLFNNIKSRFTNIYNTANKITTNIRGKVTSIWTNLTSRVKSTVSGLWSGVRNTFNNMRTGLNNIVTNTKNGIVNRWNSIKSSVTNLAKGLWTNVKKWFDKITGGAKALPKRMGDGFRSARNKAVSGMKSVGNGVIRWAGKPFNKVVDGVNWVTGKLGIKKKIPKWDYPQYAKGTRGKGHPGGIAMIGEEGEELVKLPDGRSFISPSSHTVLDLPKGTHVVPHKPTMEILRKGMTHIPHYAKGTDGWLSSLASSVGDVFSYIKSPKKLLNKILDKISIGKQNGSIPKAMVGGAWNYVKEKPYEYIKKMLGKAEEKGGALQAPVFGGKFRLSSVYGPRWGGFHGGVDFAAPTGTPIRSQSNGKVSFAGYGWNGGFGNLVRVVNGIYEHYYAHMSAVMAKTGQQVKQGDILGLVGSTGDSTGPHVHYEIRRNGQRINPLTAGNFKGFKTGGLIQSKQLSWLAEDGFPEMVIPLDPKRRTDAMKLLALTGQMLGADDRGGSKRPHQLPNVKEPTTDSNEQLIALLVEQNSHLKQSNELLTALLQKDIDIVLDTDRLGTGVARSVRKKNDNDTNTRLIYEGVKP